MVGVQFREPVPCAERKKVMSLFITENAYLARLLYIFKLTDNRIVGGEHLRL